MHPHLIDWFRNPHIQPDAAVVEKRWEVAVELASKLNRAQVVDLVRLFLFEQPKKALVDKVTANVLAHDATFPVANNTEELRLMSGVVAIASFEDRSSAADALALGIRAASWPQSRTQPARIEISSEATQYLVTEAETVRPEDFGQLPKEDQLAGALKTLVAAEAGDDKPASAASLASYRRILEAHIANADRALARQVERLSEESALLWWVIAEHSVALSQPTADLSGAAYALVAAAEAASRTRVLPPPASAGPLIARALRSCKGSAKGELPLTKYLSAVDAGWRARHVSGLNASECADLVPFATALSKTEEFGDPKKAIEVLPNICPGVTGELMLTPAAAAEQHYFELMFLRALQEI